MMTDAPNQPEDVGDLFDISRFRDDEGENRELDMTPMVDVTFLLLIFFMVTAAFSLQKSLEAPVSRQEEAAAQTVEDIEEDDDTVIVRIYPDDAVFVDDLEARGEQELLIKLREARNNGKGASAMLVMADRECRHETVVMALDAGTAVGMESVRLATVNADEF